MASVSIRTRTTKSGKRFQVRYRLGGRGYPVVHGGSFPTLKEARVRRDFIAGELAAGRNPRGLLEAMTAAPAPTMTLSAWAKRYEASRVDYAEETVKNLGSHLKAILSELGERDPANLTPADVQEWIAGLSLKPSSMRRYVASLRLLLDFAGVDPNPARDRRVKLPSIIAEEPNPPTSKQLLAILAAVPARWVLPLITIEQTAMTVGEAHTLAWGDVDVAGRQFRLRRANVKAQIRARARWVQVPAWLMEEIAATCPLEDRTAERRVFQGFGEQAARQVMRRACQAAGVPHFHPHDLRHRRISLWHGQGVPAKQLAERAGHARASMSLDTYSHVMPLEEITAEQFTALLYSRT
jgi:integrase